MRIRKIAFLLFTIMTIVVTAVTSQAASSPIVQYINDYIKEFYGVSYDYYDDTVTLDGLGTLGINMQGRQEELDKYGYLLNPLTYGDNGYEYVGGGWKRNVATIGYTRLGAAQRAYFNPDHSRNIDFYKWTYPWTGSELRMNPRVYTENNMTIWVQKHADSRWGRGSKDTFMAREYSKQGLEMNDVTGTKSALMEAAIQAGMDIVYGDITGKYLTTNASQANLPIHTIGSKPRAREGNKAFDCNWLDCLLVVTPPTDISWGTAWRFNKDSAGYYYCIDIPIAPFNMTEQFDLSTNYICYTESANKDDEVTFIAEVHSNVEEIKDNVSYTWRITDSNGNPVSGVSYGGHGTSSSGTFSINMYSPKMFGVSFKMPATSVKVSFEVNGDKKHSENNYDNNRSVVDPIDPVTVNLLQPAQPVTANEVILDYDIYSRDHNGNLASMTAGFPSRTYAGDGAASISSYTANSGILSNYEYQNSAVVNSAPFTISPWYKGLILRSGFGDNPASKVYKENGVYPVNVTQYAWGQAWRNYWTTVGTDKEGNPIIELRTSYQSFSVSTTHLPVTAYVYNGKAALAKPVTKNEVARTNLSWTSNAINFNVYRKMYHLDLGGNRVNEKNVPGRYTRSFVAQNSASIVWSAPLPLAQGYAQDRKTAANRGSKYQNAIFATDKQFAKVAYPIKSGYMFNPVGTYQCVVKSTVYYDISASEAEKKSAHEELVNKVINSFVYDNQMPYTVNGKDTYYLTGVRNADKKGILNITRNDTANITTIPHSQYQTCMEGYSESGTLNSSTNYKYREYVVSDRVSKIDAQTVITFTIGSSSKKYTHVNMKDGQYVISAKSTPFSFKGLTAPGVHLNDAITVSVKGSVYDDRG